MPVPQSKSYAGSRFQVKVDGHPITSFVKSVEGGLYKTESSTDPSGGFHIPVHHLTTRTIEPITMEIGLSGGDWVMKILQKVINDRAYSRISGEILHADINTALRFRQEFSRGLITEIMFPALDAVSKDGLYLKVKIQPEGIEIKNQTEPGAKLVPEKETKQKLFNANAFRLNLELNGKKIACEHVTKIDAITVKLGVKALQRGKYLLPEYIPTKMETSKLSVTMPLHYANDFIDWYRAAVMVETGTKDGTPYEATGSIEYLDPTRTKTLYSINLVGVAPENFTIGKTEGSSNTFKSCKFDLYCSQLKVSPSGLGK